MSNEDEHSGAESTDGGAAEEQDDEDAAVAEMYDRGMTSPGVDSTGSGDEESPEAAPADGADGTSGEPVEENGGAGAHASPDEDAARDSAPGSDDSPGSEANSAPGTGIPGEATPPTGMEGPLTEDEQPETTAGTFYVKHVEEVAVTLHEVDTGQIVTLVENPGFERHEIIEAVLVAQPPMEVSYLLQDLQSRRSIPVERSAEPPTSRIRETGRQMEEGQAIAVEREGEGEIHILSVAPGQAEETAAELLDDEMTYKNAARYDVGRVEIRTDADDGIVSIRYLP